jgi:integrase
MNDLTDRLNDYLRMRRALGFKLETQGFFLGEFVRFVEASGAKTLTAQLAISWAQLPEGVQSIHWARRLSAARGFAEFLRTIDPETEVPPRDVFGARQQRPTPHLWLESDVVRLLEAARRLQPPLRGASTEAILGLLAASGMRIGEAIDLERRDVDLLSVPPRPSRAVAQEHKGGLAIICTRARRTVSDSDIARVLRVERRYCPAHSHRALCIQPDHRRPWDAHRDIASENSRSQARFCGSHAD